MKLKIIKSGLFLFLFYLQSAHAVLQIEITKGAEGALPIAIIPFERTGIAMAMSVDVAEIVATDLQRSGKFSPIEREKLIDQPHSLEDVNFKLWKVAGIDHVVLGQVKVVSPQQYELQFRLIDVFKGGQVLGYRFLATDKTLRSIAHHISDLIYEQITGQKGAFDTKIAYITAERKVGAQPSYKLQIA
ncbi:MAG: Tol-Pal system protein TolB, partial [Gammaproteobacteria bacterium]|nr:Tol-Pal system protein TolB [Gammaproteobacteria bacterium]